MKAQLQQTRFSLSGGSGMAYYLGDLTEKKLPRGELLHPYLYLAANARLTSVLSVSLGFMRGRVSAADSLTKNSGVRNYHFRSSITDFHLLMGVNLKEAWRGLSKDKGIKKRYDDVELIDGPKLMAGIGYFHFNPEAMFEGEWYKLQPLGTEGQKIEGDYPDPYKLWQFNLKLGAEMGFRLDRHWQIDIYGAYTILFTDYLDDVGGAFPDYNELVKAPKGELASNFTYRVISPTRPSAGSKRGNPGVKDSYAYFGVKLTYSFSKAQLDLMRHK